MFIEEPEIRNPKLRFFCNGYLDEKAGTRPTSVECRANDTDGSDDVTLRCSLQNMLPMAEVTSFG